jgi:hypothetical protein
MTHEIILTEALIQACGTERGGFTGETLRALGIESPPVKGWTFRLRGTRISRENYQRALDGRFLRKWKGGVRDIRDRERQKKAQGVFEF